jgi:hypothetical protein
MTTRSLGGFRLWALEEWQGIAAAKSVSSKMKEPGFIFFLLFSQKVVFYPSAHGRRDLVFSAPALAK